VNGSVWSTVAYVATSDSRIKEDIQDINDDTALRMILAIEPKTYKYIDKIERGNVNVYGFISQQIRQVIPEAISIQKSYIPNIMLLTYYDNNIITLPSQPSKVIIYTDSRIFVSGTEVDDFHTLDKSYIFTLNVCVTQELHRRIISQDERIKELEAKMVQILNYISL
jgi:hypothetical protein